MKNIPFDHLAARTFASLLDSYQTWSTMPRLHSTAIHSDPRGYLSEIKACVDDLRLRDYNRPFLSFMDSTTGSRCEPRDCPRSSLSMILEFLRLDELLRSAVRRKRTQPVSEIVYYSRFGQQSFRYQHRYSREISVTKFVEEDLISLHDYLDKLDTPYVLSGTPSCLIELEQLGFSIFEPEFLILSGEQCPPQISKQLDSLSRKQISIYVAREIGLMGYECHRYRGIHLYSNCLEFSLDRSNSLHVRDPANYLLPSKTVSLGDVVSEFNFGKCACGAVGHSIRGFTGREYNKAYHRKRNR